MSTLGLGTLITVIVSLACSFWFFHSLMGSEGYPAIGAGIAGCAIQLFGYGFATSYLPLNRWIRKVLCIVPLALSMLSTYSALYGYLSAEKVAEELATKKQELILDILSQSSKDKQISASAAIQGVGEAYRTQAKGFLQLNDLLRDKDEKLIEKLEIQWSTASKASPLDGLVEITGDSELTTILFCVWLSIMFDMLPIISISVLSTGIKEKKHSDVVHEEFKVVKEDEATSMQSTVCSVETLIDSKERTILIDSEASIKKKVTKITSPEIDENENNSEIVQSEKTEVSSAQVKKKSHIGGEVTYEEILRELKSGQLDTNYKSVRERTGWSQWNAQEFFKNCQEQGVIEKEGRSFKVVLNCSILGQVEKSVNG